ncbi:hypothetical protein SI65_04172 [Aspergillus cristatus]|uniref:Uncharacterized protein n=1 Tax=Aspergillus cristatus TaxID=573508 RepID=A0A1E3BJK4_ASPCR|nr:hypothetical protein SI65_04172 [Aspergillus cristatus]
MYGTLIPVVRDNSVDDTHPSEKPPEEPPEGKRRRTTAEPFDNLLHNLKQFGEKNPKISEQVARLVGLYRQLWETYAAKCSEHQSIVDENQRLKQSNKQLRQEKEQTECRNADQEAHQEYIRQYFHEMFKGIADIVESLGEHTSWNPEKGLQSEKLH